MATIHPVTKTGLFSAEHAPKIEILTTVRCANHADSAKSSSARPVFGVGPPEPMIRIFMRVLYQLTPTPFQNAT